jgi:yecA family protein
MPTIRDSLQLPSCQSFSDSIASLALPFSSSELHGIMCGHLSAGAVREGIAFLGTLTPTINDPSARSAMLAIFEVYTVTQHQIESAGFEFQLLLPDDAESLSYRAESFSDWCEGFTQGIRMAGVDYDALEDEDTQDALQHITEFADLDYQSLQVEEADERALVEIEEYTRMAVLHIYNDLRTGHPDRNDGETAH